MKQVILGWLLLLTISATILWAFAPGSSTVKLEIHYSDGSSVGMGAQTEIAGDVQPTEIKLEIWSNGKKKVHHFIPAPDSVSVGLWSVRTKVGGLAK